MSDDDSLNDLIFQAKIDAEPAGNEVLVSVGPKSKGAEGVQIIAQEGNRLGRLFGRLTSIGSGQRAMFIETDHPVSFERISINAVEITSEVPFQIELTLDVRTPSAAEKDRPAVQRMANAFRDATLRTRGEGVSSNVANGPHAILKRDLENWLRATYRTREQLSEHRNENWLKKQSADVQLWLSQKYGLDARANLKIRAPNEDVVRLDGVAVETKAKDSDSTIHVKVSLSAKLEDRDLFSARALTQADLSARVTTLVDRHMRARVSLQEFRFSTQWKDDIKALIDAELKGFERTLVEYRVPPPANGYGAGPYTVRAGEATFQPAGWDNNEGREDSIAFSCDANVLIADAAKFEHFHANSSELLGGLSISRTEDVLKRWLRRELQEAIRETLHPIHRDDQGYAKLLSAWTGQSGFRAQIQSNLTQRAEVIGLEVKSIVATPAREEMKLLEGAIISIPSRGYTSSADGVEIEFSADATIKVSSFDDIRGILNRTNKPLDEIRENYIVKPLERFVRQIAYIEFFKNFEYGDWPSKADPADKEGNTNTDTGCVGWLKTKLQQTLAPEEGGGEKIELVQLVVHQSTTVFFQVYERLTKTIPQRLTVNLDMVSGGDGSITDAYEIAFDLSITGLAETNTEVFFRDWEAIAGNRSEYEAILEDCQATFASFFSAADRDQLHYAHEAGPEGKGKCETIINDQLESYLAKKYGLFGNAVSIAVRNTGAAEISILQQKNAIALEKKKVEQSYLADAARIEITAEAVKERAKHNARRHITNAQGGKDEEGLKARPEDVLSTPKLVTRTPNRLPKSAPEPGEESAPAKPEDE